MKTQQCALIAAVALALTACNRPAPAPTTTNAPSNAPAPQDGALAKVIRDKMGKNMTFGNDNMRMRDGKLLLLTKDGKDIGTVAEDGTLVIDGTEVALTPAQRELTVKLHAQALQVTQDAIAIAGDAANVATTAVSEGMKLAMGSILRNDNSAQEAEFEKKIEATVRDKIKPGALKICNSSNQMEETKRQLANVVPEYKQYYTADKPCDVAEMTKEFAGDVADEATSADLPSSTK